MGVSKFSLRMPEKLETQSYAGVHNIRILTRSNQTVSSNKILLVLNAAT